MDIVNPDVMDIVGQDLVDGSDFVDPYASSLGYVAESLELFVRKSSKCSSVDRNRVVLSFKKYIIDLYFEFLNKPASSSLEDANIILQDLPRNSDVTDRDCSSDDENVKKDSKQVKSIKSFLVDYNSTQVPEDQLHHGCVFKWLKAYYRGEFEEWGGLNDLSKANAKAQKIMDHIYQSLQVSFPETAVWNKIIRKSRYSPDKYGVVAKKDVPRGTVIGFFDGDYVVSNTPIKLCGFHKYELDQFTYIDGSSFTSCFARYYASSGNAHFQNVSVHRLQTFPSHNRRVCFMSIRDIAKGEEFVIAHNQDFFRSKHKSSTELVCQMNNITAQSKADLFGK
jgi:hypothetical protein